MSLKMICALGLVAATAAAAAAAPSGASKQVPSHCLPGEKDVLSCQLKKSPNVISVCLAGEVLYFRLGKPGRVELSYPGSRLPAVKAFEYVQQLYPGGQNVSLSFKHEGAGYTVDASCDDPMGGCPPSLSIERDPKDPKSKLNQSWQCGSGRGDLGGLSSLPW